MTKTNSKLSISKHLQTDLLNEYHDIMELAGDNPSKIQNRAEFNARWTAMIESIDSIDRKTRYEAVEMLKNPDQIVLASIASYFLGASSNGISYNAAAKYGR